MSTKFLPSPISAVRLKEVTKIDLVFFICSIYLSPSFTEINSEKLMCHKFTPTEDTMKYNWSKLQLFGHVN